MQIILKVKNFKGIFSWAGAAYSRILPLREAQPSFHGECLRNFLWASSSETGKGTILFSFLIDT